MINSWLICSKDACGSGIRSLQFKVRKLSRQARQFYSNFGNFDADFGLFLAYAFGAYRRLLRYLFIFQRLTKACFSKDTPPYRKKGVLMKRHWP